MPQIKKWTTSKNKWFRRAAAVVLIYPLRKGKYLNDALDVAIALLKDKEDLVQKGYGWMLKEASVLCQKEIFAFLIKNKKLMPRVALRYAVEKFPKDLKKQAMKAD